MRDARSFGVLRRTLRIVDAIEVGARMCGGEQSESSAVLSGETLFALAAARASELPGADCTHPFGPDWDVYKVRDRVFMLATRLVGRPIVTVKVSPPEGDVLRESFAQISPGYHMNKRHWITLDGFDSPTVAVVPGGDDNVLDEALVEDLITRSYLLVLERNVPRSKWPVDPATFGRRDACRR